MTDGETDIVFGFEAIGRVLGLTARQAMYQDEQSRLPTFRVGRKVCARRAALLEWAQEQEQLARQGRGNG